METVGRGDVKCVMIELFAIERIANVKLTVQRRDVKERGDLVRWIIQSVRERRTVDIVGCHLTEIRVRSVVFVDGEFVRRLRKLRMRQRMRLSNTGTSSMRLGNQDRSIRESRKAWK